MDPHLKHLLERLGQALNESISDSEPIAETIAEIKREGYDVYFLLQATIGFKRRAGEDDFASAPLSVDGKNFTEQDAEFLKALKIKIED